MQHPIEAIPAQALSGFEITLLSDHRREWHQITEDQNLLTFQGRQKLYNGRVLIEVALQR